MTTAGGTASGAITIQGGGLSTMSQANVATGGVTVQGTDPANGIAMPYYGRLNYNLTGAASVAGGRGDGGQVRLPQARRRCERTSPRPRISSPFKIWASSAATPPNLITWFRRAAARICSSAPGAVIQNSNSDSGTIVPATLTPLLGTAGNYYYGFTGTSAAGVNWTIGSANGVNPWKGLAGGSDENSGTHNVVNDPSSPVITLVNNADFVGLPNGLTSSSIGLITGINGNELRVHSKITGTPTNLTIRGGGNVRFSNISNDFTATINVDAAQLNVQADPGNSVGTAYGTYQDGVAGNAANDFALTNGGRVLWDGFPVDFTLPAARTVTLGTGGGGLGVGMSSGVPSVVTLASANQLSGSTKFTKYGFGTLELAAPMATLTGAVNVSGGTLKMTTDALPNISSIRVGIDKAAYTDVFLAMNNSGQFVLATGSRSGAILLDSAVTYTGKLGNLSNIVLEGGAIGYTGNKAFTTADFNLGAQTFPTQINAVPLMANSLTEDNLGLNQGEGQRVKVLHLGGQASAGTMTVSGGISDALGGGSPVLLMKSGNNSVLDLTGTGANTYTGGTMIIGGEVKISNANQLGSGGVMVTGTYGTDPNQPIGKLHIVDNVTFAPTNIFRFVGSNTSLGTIGATTTYGPSIDVDAGKTAVIKALDMSFDRTGNIGGALLAKTGAGTLKLELAANAFGKMGLNFGLYIGGGTVETDSMPWGAYESRNPDFRRRQSDGRRSAGGGQLRLCHRRQPLRFCQPSRARWHDQHPLRQEWRHLPPGRHRQRGRQPMGRNADLQR